MNRSMMTGHFIAGEAGPLFTLLREPAAGATECVLVVPPFAEEMNKSRRMVAVVSKALAEQGSACVVPDLFGTGDSGGDFSDAHWTLWQSDLAHVANWCAQRNLRVSGILAIRFGAALAAAALAGGAIPPVKKTALWQPFMSGSRCLSQFLRLRIAASLVELDRKETLAELQQQLRSGAVVEVAGYGVSGRLAQEIDAVSAPTVLPPQFGDCLWLEVVRDATAELNTASTNLIAESERAGAKIAIGKFVGEPFWAATEIVVQHECIDATKQFFGSLNAAGSERTHN
jgi:exosortase A-associated hydrolase 2